eukprot:349360-Pyramimonas_sp.AAC.1
MERGRAKDRELNALCRRSSAHHVACNILWRRRHLISARNCSHEDSRLADRLLVHPGAALGADRLRARLHRCGLHDLAL